MQKLRYRTGFSVLTLILLIYKITKIVRTLWLAWRSVCTIVGKHCCGVQMFCFSRANNASTNLKKVCFEFKTRQVYFIYQFLRRLKLEKSLIVNCFMREIRILNSIFLQNKNWLRVQHFVYKTLRLVRISLLINAITKSFAFFLGKVIL